MADSAPQSPSAAPGWLEVSVEADAESVEAVAELFSRYAYNQGVAIFEPYVQDRDGDNLKLDPNRPVRVSAYLPAGPETMDRVRALEEGLWHLRQIGRVGDLIREARPEEDWANAWKEHFQVTRIGRRIVVRPTWRDYEPAPGDVVVDLDPGMAFGTGLHPTTELCLRWLEELPLAGARLLDAGAGSGILSIAALKLGASAVTAIEIDDVAVKALRHNLALNGVEGRVRVESGDVTRSVPDGGVYDVVLANIISRVLIDAAPVLARAARPGGTLILSGVIEPHEQPVRDAYARQGVEWLDRRTGGDWVSLLGRRRA